MAVTIRVLVRQKETLGDDLGYTGEVEAAIAGSNCLLVLRDSGQNNEFGPLYDSAQPFVPMIGYVTYLFDQNRARGTTGAIRGFDIGRLFLQEQQQVLDTTIGVCDSPACLQAENLERSIV